MRGGGGDDRLYGRGNSDHVQGGSGNDVLIGGRGRDVLLGGSGDDLVDVRGAEGRESVVCGPGRDVALVDASDIATGNCERIVRDGQVLNPTPKCPRDLQRFSRDGEQPQSHDLLGQAARLRHPVRWQEARTADVRTGPPLADTLSPRVPIGIAS